MRLNGQRAIICNKSRTKEFKLESVVAGRVIHNNAQLATRRDTGNTHSTNQDMQDQPRTDNSSTHVSGRAGPDPPDAYTSALPPTVCFPQQPSTKTASMYM